MSRLLWFCVVLAVAAYVCGPLIDPDLWWHIVVGRWILAHRELPTVDLWTVFGSGTVWRAYSWSSEILFASVESSFGLHGLVVLKLLFALLVVGIFSLVFAAIARNPFLGTLIGVYVTLGCYNHFTLRPQVLIWIFFALLLGICVRIERQGLGVYERLAILVTMSLWANTHISSILGILVVAFWNIKSLGFSRSVVAVLYAVLGTLLTPYLGGEWITFAETASHPFAHASIIEFQPATLHQYATGFLVLLCFVVGVFFHIKPKRFFHHQLLLLGIFVIGGLAVVKFIPFALLVSGAILANFFGNESAKGLSTTALGEGILRLERGFQWLPKPGLSVFLVCLSAVQIFALWSNPLDRNVTPQAAVDFIMEQQLPSPLLNTFGNGGYLLYRRANASGEVSEKVVIDGRTNLITAELWSKFSSALNGTSRWKEFLELVRPKTILWRWDSPLTSILSETSDWCMVFSSGSPNRGHVVFVTRDVFMKMGTLTSTNCR